MEIREPETVYTLLPDLKEEVLKVTNIGQGQYQREAFVIVGDGQGLIGLGKRCSSNDREAIVGAKRNARLSLFQIEVPQNKTVPKVVTGNFANVTVKLEPFVKVILAQPMIVRILEMAGFEAALQTGNCEKSTGSLIEAVFDALNKLVSS